MNPEHSPNPQIVSDTLKPDKPITDMPNKRGVFRSLLRRRGSEDNTPNDSPEIAEQYGDTLSKLGDAWNCFNELYDEAVEDPILDEVFRGFVEEATYISEAQRRERRRLEQFTNGDKEKLVELFIKSGFIINNNLAFIKRYTDIQQTTGARDVFAVIQSRQTTAAEAHSVALGIFTNRVKLLCEDKKTNTYTFSQRLIGLRDSATKKAGEIFKAMDKVNTRTVDLLEKNPVGVAQDILGLVATDETELFDRDEAILRNYIVADHQDLGERSLLARAKNIFQEALKQGLLIDDFVEATLHADKDNVHSFYQRIGVTKQQLTERIKAEYGNLPTELQSELDEFNRSWSSRLLSAVDKTTRAHINTGMIDPEDVKAEAFRMFRKINGVSPVNISDPVVKPKQTGRAAAKSLTAPLGFATNSGALYEPRDVQSLAQIGNNYIAQLIDKPLDEYLNAAFDKQLSERSIGKFIDVIETARKERTFSATDGIEKIGGTAIWLFNQETGRNNKMSLFRIDLRRIPGVSTTAKEKDARIVFSPTKSTLFLARALHSHKDYTIWLRQHEV